jgi:hypothetical protein
MEGKKENTKSLKGKQFSIGELPFELGTTQVILGECSGYGPCRHFSSFSWGYGTIQREINVNI